MQIDITCINNVMIFYIRSLAVKKTTVKSFGKVKIAKMEKTVVKKYSV